MPANAENAKSHRPPFDNAQAERSSIGNDIH